MPRSLEIEQLEVLKPHRDELFTLASQALLAEQLLKDVAHTIRRHTNRRPFLGEGVKVRERQHPTQFDDFLATFPEEKLDLIAESLLSFFKNNPELKLSLGQLVAEFSEYDIEQAEDAVINYELGNFFYAKLQFTPEEIERLEPIRAVVDTQFKQNDYALYMITQKVGHQPFADLPLADALNLLEQGDYPAYLARRGSAAIMVNQGPQGFWKRAANGLSEEITSIRAMLKAEVQPGKNMAQFLTESGIITASDFARLDGFHDRVENNVIPSKKASDTINNVDDLLQRLKEEHQYGLLVMMSMMREVFKTVKSFDVATLELKKLIGFENIHLNISEFFTAITTLGEETPNDPDVTEVLSMLHQGFLQETGGKEHLEVLLAASKSAKSAQDKIEQISPLISKAVAITSQNVLESIKLVKELATSRVSHPNNFVRSEITKTFTDLRTLLLEKAKDPAFGFDYLYNAIATIDQLFGSTESKKTIIEKLKHSGYSRLQPQADKLPPSEVLAGMVEILTSFCSGAINEDKCQRCLDLLQRIHDFKVESNSADLAEKVKAGTIIRNFFTQNAVLHKDEYIFTALATANEIINGKKVFDTATASEAEEYSKQSNADDEELVAEPFSSPKSELLIQVINTKYEYFNSMLEAICIDNRQVGQATIGELWESLMALVNLGTYQNKVPLSKLFLGYAKDETFRSTILGLARENQTATISNLYHKLKLEPTYL